MDNNLIKKLRELDNLKIAYKLANNYENGSNENLDISMSGGIQLYHPDMEELVIVADDSIRFESNTDFRDEGEYKLIAHIPGLSNPVYSLIKEPEEGVRSNTPNSLKLCEKLIEEVPNDN